MFEFLTANPAVALLKGDHDRIKGLFDQFEAAKTRSAKVKIVRAALTTARNPREARAGTAAPDFV